MDKKDVTIQSVCTMDGMMPREEIFHKFKEGTLHSGSGSKVTSRAQAIAIAMKYGSAEHASGKRTKRKKHKKEK